MSMGEKILRWIPILSAIVSLVCIVFSGVLTTVVFIYSRFDHDLKLIALTGVISIASQMMATASTLLVGKTFGNDVHAATSLPDPLPPNSTLTIGATTLKTPSEETTSWK